MFYPGYLAESKTMTNEQLVIPGMTRRPPNPPTPESLKREGIEKALANERAIVRQTAYELIEAMTDWDLEFTADDIAESWEHAGVTFHHPNVAGGVIRAALMAGVMERTGRYVPSRRLSRRASMVAVYRAGGGEDDS